MIYLNPFNKRTLARGDLFPSREYCYDLLVSDGRRASAVVSGPPGSGKTSLVRLVQEQLAQSGIMTLHVGLLGVESATDFATRVAAAFFSETMIDGALSDIALKSFSSWQPVVTTKEDRPKSLITARPREALSDPLNRMMDSIDAFSGEANIRINIALDDFTHILPLRDLKHFERVIRNRVPLQNAVTYFFIGPKTPDMDDLFGNSNRAYCPSMLHIELPEVPIDEGVEFIVSNFRIYTRSCREDVARRLVEIVRSHPAYIQKVAFHLFAMGVPEAKETHVAETIAAVVVNENRYLETIYFGQQPLPRRLLAALAKEPVGNPFDAAYVERHFLDSPGGAKNAHAKLLNANIIFQSRGLWKIADPIFALWIDTFEATKGAYFQPFEAIWRNISGEREIIHEQ